MTTLERAIQSLGFTKQAFSWRLERDDVVLTVQGLDEELPTHGAPIRLRVFSPRTPHYPGHALVSLVFLEFTEFTNALIPWLNGNA